MLAGWITQLRKGLLEFCVLSVLRRGEGHGYEIVQRLRVEPALAVTESTVYPILARLRAEGLLKVREEPSAAGPPRRCFSLTAAGRVRLAQMNAHWEQISESLERLQFTKPKEE
jgi:PadR family transcriptional regulator PadR